MGNAAFAKCALEDEKQALDLKALQSSMMVAALSCGQQDAYNDFVEKYQHNISDGGDTIRTYFKARFGSSHEHELNRFVTKLANKATQESMYISSDLYCMRMHEVFTALLDMPNQQFANFVKGYHFETLHGISACS
tara:strand:- start:158 stop:565 length:408 start_codon:yes stop_codon:yes gene_type:complete